MARTTLASVRDPSPSREILDYILEAQSFT